MNKNKNNDRLKEIDIIKQDSFTIVDLIQGLRAPNVRGLLIPIIFFLRFC